MLVPRRGDHGATSCVNARPPARLGHEPSHPLAPDAGADATELAVDAWRAIGGPRALIDVPDGFGQIGVVDASR